MTATGEVDNSASERAALKISPCAFSKLPPRASASTEPAQTLPMLRNYSRLKPLGSATNSLTDG
jgi:hypothetical protein